MSLFELYSDEAAFRDQFVRPLLNKLGFFSIAELHGMREFGKDFVFSELHRLGGVRHYAAQVKHEKMIKLSGDVNQLIAQVEQAFANKFQLSSTLQSSHVSGVYIFNSGGITEAAKDDFISRLRRKEYGENVHLLDGKTLQDLDQWGTFQSNQFIRESLTGLYNQMVFNLTIWQTTKPFYAQDSGPIELRSAVMHGIDEYISRPLLPAVIDIFNVLQLRQWAISIENANTWIMRSAINTTDLRIRHGSAIMQICDNAIKSAQNLIVQLHAALSLLGKEGFGSSSLGPGGAGVRVPAGDPGWSAKVY